MATRPNLVTYSNSSVDVLNAIRNSASIDYRNYVPIATPDAEIIRSIGNTLMDYPELQNEFLRALVNRIARVLVRSAMFENPWQMFKQGKLDYGETIEEVYVDLCKVHQYDPATAEQKVFAREIPDVRSAFHVLNYQKFYKDSIEEKTLDRAFNSIDGVNDLITRIIAAMVTSASYDEFLVMKFMLLYRMAVGAMYPTNVAEEGNGVTHEQATKLSAEAFKAMSNKLTFLSAEYNLAGVHNATKKENQYLIIDADFDAAMDVQVLATAFNMDKAEFMGHRVLVDTFSKIDINRLNEIFDDDNNPATLDPNFVAMKTAMGVQSDGSIPRLQNVKAALIDEEFWKVYDVLDLTQSLINPEGLYTNYWYHVSKIFSVSPFANAIAFTSDTPAITSVTVSPATATITIPDSGVATVQLNASVVASGITPRGVEWSVTGTGVSINASGLLTVTEDATAGNVTVTAKSIYDATKTGTATITLVSGE